MTEACRPDNPILIPPHLHRCIFTDTPTSSEVFLQPTPFGARQPSLPVARTITLTRIATTEGVDKRYERSWLRGLKEHFLPKDKGKERSAEDRKQLVRRGDIISVPVWIDRPVTDDEDETNSSSDESDVGGESLHSPYKRKTRTGVAYFMVTALSYEPLIPFEEDFRSSLSSKARAGELGCWVGVGDAGSTKMILTGVERARLRGKNGDRPWHSICEVSIPRC